MEIDSSGAQAAKSSSIDAELPPAQPRRIRVSIYPRVLRVAPNHGDMAGS